MWVYKMAVKVKLLSFDGEDPVGWIMHTKTYLKIQGASEEVKVRLEKLGYLHKNGMLQYEKLYLYCRLRSSSCFYVSMVPEKKSCTLHSMVVIKVHIVKWRRVSPPHASLPLSFSRRHVSPIHAPEATETKHVTCNITLLEV
ncbi:unnamed protein product [Vicia faba]|uniref:Uncharacterized protein n=1 Tax=Vicia faba TaxID=3906 RepID=A0AAV0YK01_VICFA|nr:unnamed protein product [Vicia faba]